MVAFDKQLSGSFAQGSLAAEVSRSSKFKQTPEQANTKEYIYWIRQHTKALASLTLDSWPASLVMSESMDTSSEIRRAYEQGLLEILKQPRYPQPTENMRKEMEIQQQGRQLWEKVLQQFQHHKRLMIEVERQHRRKTNSSTPGGNAPSAEGSENRFRFLDLPRELRDRIYEYYFDEEEEDPYRPNYRTRSPTTPPGYLYRNSIVPRPPPPSMRKVRQETRHCRQLDGIEATLVDLRVKSGEISSRVHQAYRAYRTDWDVEEGQWWRGYRPSCELVVVNGRGNLCATLSPLSLVCSQTFTETSDYHSPEDRTYLVKVVDFRFNVAYRFFRMLRSYGIIVPGSQVWILHDSRHYDDAPTNKFDRIEQLIRNHWFHGFPLWESQVCTWDHHEEFHRITSIHLGENDKTLFAQWIYYVRQSAALHKIDQQAWEEAARPFIQHFEALRLSGNDTLLSLVEKVIAMFRAAIEYRLGYEYRVQPSDRRKFWDECEYQHFNSIKPSEEDYEVVNIAQRYGEEVDVLLREKLGEAYEEWEELRDEECVPLEGGVI